MLFAIKISPSSLETSVAVGMRSAPTPALAIASDLNNQLSFEILRVSG